MGVQRELGRFINGGLSRVGLTLSRTREGVSVQENPPQVELHDRHVVGAQLLPNRLALLDNLPGGGTVAEVGVDRGDFSREILRRVQPEKLILIDMWGSERFHEGLMRSVAVRFQEEIDRQQVVIARGHSVEVGRQLANSCLDWAYIDTDHSYQTTKSELETYAVKVKRGGLLCGDDYTLGNWESGYRYGVIEAVHEFCVAHNWRFVFLSSEPGFHRSFALQRIDD